MAPEVVVVGSINHDLTVFTERLPAPGETVLGQSHMWGGGGKGANQAVAAARLGSRVAMVGRVGDDESGRLLRSDLVAEGIEVSAVSVDPDMPTGLAVITVDREAENAIVVSPGANMSLRPQHIDHITNASVVLTQLEIPLETISAVSASATGTLILNPAPAKELAETDLLADVDILIPNRSELSLLAGSKPVNTIDDAVDAARLIEFTGEVVVTLGSEGALLVSGGSAAHFEAPTVDAIDPTGAGDAFCGAIAHQLSRGAAMDEAVRFAVGAGAVAASRKGAQTSMPTFDEVQQLLAAG